MILLALLCFGIVYGVTDRRCSFCEWRAGVPIVDGDVSVRVCLECLVSACPDRPALLLGGER
jgi:hypothetical protein